MSIWVRTNVIFLKISDVILGYTRSVSIGTTMAVDVVPVQLTKATIGLNFIAKEITSVKSAKSEPFKLDKFCYLDKAVVQK